MKAILAIGFAALATTLSGCWSSVPVSSKEFTCEGYPRQELTGATTYCEERRHADLPVSGPISVRAENGDIAAFGAARTAITLTAFVYATAATEDRARKLAGEVQIHTADSDFYASGPQTDGVESWSASFDVLAPVRSDLTATAANGHVGALGLHGVLSLDASNGVVEAHGVGGSLSATAANGEILVVLSGESWDGAGARLEAANGDVAYIVPDGYSARFDLQADNGSVHSDFEGGTREPSGNGERYAITLGGGGALLKAATSNGDASLRRAD